MHAAAYAAVVESYSMLHQHVQLDAVCCACSRASSLASAGARVNANLLPRTKTASVAFYYRENGVSLRLHLRFRWNDFIVVALADELFLPVLMSCVCVCLCPDFTCHRCVSEMANLLVED